MNVIGIEGSGMAASVAVLNEEKLLCLKSFDHKKTHSETLMPMIDEVLKSVDLTAHDLDLIAVSKGPGSFTGLRIAAASAKGLSQAAKIPVIGVSGLAVLAYALYASADLIVPVMDARRDQVYCGGYTFKSGNGGYDLESVFEDRALAADDLIELLNKDGKRVIFTGDGVKVIKGSAEKDARFEYSFAPSGFNRQNAASVAALGMKDFKEGKGGKASDLKLEYLRKSQAEREREEGIVHGK